jgi:hypothetical protein
MFLRACRDMKKEEDVKVPEEDDDDDDLHGFTALGSAVARIKHVVVLVVLLLLLGVMACCVIGLSIDVGSLVKSFYYWMFVLQAALSAVGITVFAVGMTKADPKLLGLTMVILLAATAWSALTAIVLGLILFSCNGDPMCADNLDCCGTVFAAYGGPTGRFLATFASVLAEMVVYLFAAFMAWRARAIVRGKKKQGSLIAHQGEIAVMILVAVVLWGFSTSLVGVPINAGDVGIATNFYYWTFLIVLILPTVGAICFYVGLMRASIGGLTFAIAMFWIAALWDFVATIVFLILYFICSSSVICADNLDCCGNSVGPYGGKSWRYIFAFAFELFGMVIYFIAGFMAWTTRRNVARHGYRQEERNKTERLGERTAAGPPPAVGCELRDRKAKS